MNSFAAPPWETPASDTPRPETPRPETPQPETPQPDTPAQQRPLTDSERGRLAAIAAVHREIAEMDAVEAAVAAGLRMRSARADGRSVAYSIRLDPGELKALEHAAAARGLKPTALARNLIRVGLAPAGAADVLGAVDRLASAVDELGELVGRPRRLPSEAC